MSEQEKQDSQKTVVAFIAGLLIGGLLVYVFSSPDESKSTMEDGDAAEITLTETTNTSATSDTENALAEDSAVRTENSKGGDVATMKTGAGSISVTNQAAGNMVNIDSATFPNDEGWIGVRDYTDGQLGGILGVARFSNEQGLIPTSVELLRATESGQSYALVFYTESGDRIFNLSEDVQISDVVATFTAQ